jgi:hypothetical protein
MKKIGFRLGKKEQKRCSFGISGTGPKLVQPLRFAVFTVEPVVFGFLSLFPNFSFFIEPDWIEHRFTVEPADPVRFLKPWFTVLALELDLNYRIFHLISSID